MKEYLRNLKSAFKKMRKDQSIAGNQLVFKEKEALLLTSVCVGIPIVGMILTAIMKLG